MGAKKYNICSDITTTFPINGIFDEKQKQIYEIVLTAQQNAIKKIKPGISYRDITMQSFEDILKGLQEIGLVKGTLEELMKNNVVQYFMPHSLGHYLGYNTHDVGL